MNEPTHLALGQHPAAARRDGVDEGEHGGDGHGGALGVDEKGRGEGGDAGHAVREGVARRAHGRWEQLGGRHPRRARRRLAAGGADGT